MKNNNTIDRAMRPRRLWRISIPEKCMYDTAIYYESTDIVRVMSYPGAENCVLELKFPGTNDREADIFLLTFEDSVRDRFVRQQALTSIEKLKVFCEGTEWATVEDFLRGTASTEIEEVRAIAANVGSRAFKAWLKSDSWYQHGANAAASALCHATTGLNASVYEAARAACLSSVKGSKAELCSRYDAWEVSWSAANSVLEQMIREGRS